MRLSDASFEKHDYAKFVKRKIKSVTLDLSLLEIMHDLGILIYYKRSKGLCVSLLFYPQFQYESSHQPSNHNVPNVSQLKQTITAFKRTLELTADRSREIERDTREQRNSQLWFAVRSHHITASIFGVTYHSAKEYFNSYGIEKEKSAIEEYITIQHNQGHKDLVVAFQRVYFNQDYWNTKLLPKLISFYDNCVAPELVSPIHPLRFPLTNHLCPD